MIASTMSKSRIMLKPKRMKVSRWIVRLFCTVSVSATPEIDIMGCRQSGSPGQVIVLYPAITCAWWGPLSDASSCENEAIKVVFLGQNSSQEGPSLTHIISPSAQYASDGGQYS